MACQGHNCNHVEHKRENLTLVTKLVTDEHILSWYQDHDNHLTNSEAIRLLTEKAEKIWPDKVDTCCDECRCQIDTTKPANEDITTIEIITIRDHYIDDPGLGKYCEWFMRGTVNLNTKSWKGICITDGRKKIPPSSSSQE